MRRPNLPAQQQQALARLFDRAVAAAGLRPEAAPELQAWLADLWHGVSGGPFAATDTKKLPEVWLGSGEKPAGLSRWHATVVVWTGDADDRYEVEATIAGGGRSGSVRYLSHPMKKPNLYDAPTLEVRDGEVGVLLANHGGAQACCAWFDPRGTNPWT